MSSIERAMERKNMTREGDVSASDTTLALDSLDQDSTSPGIAVGQGEKSSQRFHLDLRMLSQKGFVVPTEPRSRIAEEYRMIKRPLLKRALDHSAASNEYSNVIMVTSALSGEGKTFTSINLAMSIVMEYNHTVLLIDADVVRPELTRTFNLRGRPGLVDVLMDSTLDLADVMVRTDIANLRVVGAGEPHSRSTELLASQRMAELAEDVSRRYPERIIIVDSSPLLAASQPSALAHLMGQIVLVVEAGRTSQTAVKEALSQLDQPKLVWLLMNKNRQTLGHEYYGGHYYSSYFDG
ncbi:protein-tyrosine kinase [Nitrosococcus halophilus Nc 4]|uniref:non-specific protein-tyrosine kinase n=1 Tax=Nitrosococcus halophilus (strain Nc4) TaxID=472759 RepID=D5C045_NITHN|nr:XrtA-associated tyrosine autokinase [Nitrosococcus halophilus]ADE16292.1 protein-tyrosine kinase [Nitrosococcus halophilus Nc 4]